ncbi:hypothetical protein [Streptomyces spirodelae]|uniref:Transposase n=1 Tax=Streptomyces spirodelae TaxID=2812904 RepID=A0ABS3WQ82_9ACTN|nr:hypothetical protein [Streptomyces spirodelae]MBO8185276.1 hypothetical protein [Streptomyces spirodelae]
MGAAAAAGGRVRPVRASYSAVRNYVRKRGLREAMAGLLLRADEQDIGVDLMPTVRCDRRVTVRERCYSVPARFFDATVRVKPGPNGVWVGGGCCAIVCRPMPTRCAPYADRGTALAPAGAAAVMVGTATAARIGSATTGPVASKARKAVECRAAGRS